MENLKIDYFLPEFSKEAADALYKVAYDSYQGGRYEDALTYFNILTRQNKDRRDGWMGLGASLQLLKRYEDAIAAFGYAAILNENDPYVHFYAAECYHLLENDEKAMQALESALACAQNKDLKDLEEQLSLIKDLWTQGGNDGC